MSEKKREFTITVDVEACNRSRATNDYVSKLIWGDYKDQSQRCGIEEMMDIGDSTGIKFSMFLDIAETELYGDEIRDVGRRIVQRGHDLQFHLHPEILPEKFWLDRGYQRPVYRGHLYNKEEAFLVMRHFTEELTKLRGTTPTAFRGGVFRTNEHFLAAQKELCIPISSNHSYSNYINQKRTPIAEPEDTIFLWENNIAEIAVTQVKQSNGWNPMAIPSGLDKEMSWRGILNSEAKKDYSTGPVVFLLHSWSLLQYSQDKKKLFVGTSSHRLKKLHNICEIAAELFEPITFTEFGVKIQEEAYGAIAVKKFS